MPDSHLIPAPLPSQTEDEINLLDLLIVIAKNKKMILSVTIVSALLAVGISLLLPNIYTATKIFPSQSNQSSSVNSFMLAQLGGLAGAAGSALGLTALKRFRHVLVFGMGYYVIARMD